MYILGFVLIVNKIKYSEVTVLSSDSPTAATWAYIWDITQYFQRCVANYLNNLKAKIF